MKEQLGKKAKKKKLLNLPGNSPQLFCHIYANPFADNQGDQNFYRVYYDVDIILTVLIQPAFSLKSR